MSVINQMLKDLDARGHGDASRRQALASVGQGARAHGRSRSMPLLKILGLLSIVGGLGVLLGWVLLSSPSALVPASVPGIDGPEEPLDGIAAQEAEPLAVEPAIAAVPTPVTEGANAGPSGSLAVASAPAAPQTASSTAPPVKPEQAAIPTPSSAPSISTAPAALSTPESPSAAVAPVPASRARIERIEMPPTDPLAKVREALANGDARSALSQLAALPPAVSASGEVDALAAAAHQLQNAHAEAIAAYTRALRRQSDIGAWWAGLGISFEAEGRSSEALSAYREALRRGPLEPALADYLGGRVDDLAARDSSR